MIHSLPKRSQKVVIETQLHYYWVSFLVWSIGEGEDGRFFQHEGWACSRLRVLGTDYLARHYKLG